MIIQEEYFFLLNQTYNLETFVDIIFSEPKIFIPPVTI